MLLVVVKIVLVQLFCGRGSFISSICRASTSFGDGVSATGLNSFATGFQTLAMVKHHTQKDIALQQVVLMVHMQKESIQQLVVKHHTQRVLILCQVVIIHTLRS